MGLPKVRGRLEDDPFIGSSTELPTKRLVLHLPPSFTKKGINNPDTSNIEKAIKSSKPQRASTTVMNPDQAQPSPQDNQKMEAEDQISVKALEPSAQTLLPPPSDSQRKPRKRKSKEFEESCYQSDPVALSSDEMEKENQENGQTDRRQSGSQQFSSQHPNNIEVSDSDEVEVSDKFPSNEQPQLQQDEQEKNLRENTSKRKIKQTEPELESETEQKTNMTNAQIIAEEYTKSQKNSISDENKKEISLLLRSFPGLSAKYKIMDKIGEGTFSTVYKAIDLLNLSKTHTGQTVWASPPIKRKQSSKNNSVSSRSNSGLNVPTVALKRIYVTSSPQRIYNELQLLHSLVGCPNVAPLIDAVRHEDQVIAVLPFYKHSDFRDFYRDLPLSGIKIYMYELFTALSFIHEKKILHRDIKPTNFLYNPFTRRGVLVDFGLAEREAERDHNACPCVQGGFTADQIAPANAFPSKGYLKDDQRPGRRANRAGTRGFRAPEVLLQCSNQTTKVDTWSAGVMLLTLLSRRFPFFNSTDDVNALIEITSIFGISEMRKVAQLHGLALDSNLPKLESSRSLGGLLYSSIFLEAKEGDTLADDSPAWEILFAFDKRGRIENSKLGAQYKEAMDLLEMCLKLDSRVRASADDALKMKFFDGLRCDKIDEEDGDDIILD